MSQWVQQRIDGFGRVVTGKTPSSERPNEFGTEAPFLTPSDIPGTQKFVTTDRFLSQTGMDAHKRLVLPTGSTSVVCIGATIGKCCMTYQLTVTNQQINSIVPDVTRHSPNFVYYLSTTLKDALVNFAGGSATPIINKSTFSGIKVIAPGLIEQRKIAAVLSTYDDLIENNRRRIALLERMAEQLYREWFVRFRFPGYQDAKFEKGVPRDWKKGHFSDLCALQRGFDLPDSQITPGAYPVVASTSIKAYHSTFKVEPPVITTGRSGSLGEVLWINEKAWPLNTALFVKSFQGNSPFFIFHTLRSMHLENFNSGAGVPSLNRNHLSSLPVSIPPPALQEAFAAQVAPMQALRESLASACAELTKTRDLLLPRLISGKLRVDELDIQFPPSMQAEGA